MKNLIYDRTVVYNVGYHLVWSVKYRRKVLVGKIETALKRLLNEISKEKGFILKEVEVMPDHVHVFISAKPKFSPSYIYKMLKGISSRRLFLKHPEIRERLWGDKLVKQYIKDQKIR